jgi:hypothetical protein
MVIAHPGLLFQVKFASALNVRKYTRREAAAASALHRSRAGMLVLEAHYSLSKLVRGADAG